jgi:hypothetical protein
MEFEGFALIYTVFRKRTSSPQPCNTHKILYLDMSTLFWFDALWILTAAALCRV